MQKAYPQTFAKKRKKAKPSAKTSMIHSKMPKGNYKYILFYFDSKGVSGEMDWGLRVNSIDRYWYGFSVSVEPM